MDHGLNWRRRLKATKQAGRTNATARLETRNDIDRERERFCRTLVDQHGTDEEKSMYFSGKFGRVFTNLQGSIYI
jgi:hypothetical protein